MRRILICALAAAAGQVLAARPALADCARYPTCPRATRVARPLSRNGFEPDPVLTIAMRREALALLADATGETSLLRASLSVSSDVSRIRELVEAEAIEEAQRRATYIQVEEEMGTTRAKAPPAALAAGAGLMVTGIALHGFMSANDAGDALSVRPAVWPPGIDIHGTFSLP